MKVTAILCFISVIFSIHVHAQVEDFQYADFKRADSVAALYPGHSLKNLKNLADKLTTPLPTQAEKFRAIYKWVCNNIAYDYGLFLQNKKQRQKLKHLAEINTWNKQFSSRVFKTLLNKEKTICTGYAYLVRELSSHAGLRCVIVDGYSRNAVANVNGDADVNHSWNAIQLNSKWYLCDATWSAGVYLAGALGYVKKFDESYFLPDPFLFIRNHYPLDSTWMLLDHKPTLGEFLSRPLIYSSLYRYKIDQLLPETFDVATTKGKTISFQFRKKSVSDTAHVALSINGPNKTETIYPNLDIDPSGLYCIDQTFSTKGTHVVHLLLDMNYVCTYTVVVK
jgi:hypothetical protein